MFEHATAAPPDPNIIADQEARIIPADLILPPPALLWEWLSYIYQTTGEWWRPPTVNNTTRPALEPRPAPVVSVKEYQSYSRSSQPAPFPAKKTKSPSATSLSGRTGFDYRASQYYEAAGRLLEQAASRHISDENFADCRLVLALLIAWSHFPLFEGLEVNGAGWMALSFSRGACELTMRASAFKSSLEALEAAGLLQLANLSEGLINGATLAELHRRRANLEGEAASLFNSHFFQKNTTLYILTHGSATALPEFKPFGERLAGMGKTSEPVAVPDPKQERLAGSFQKASCKNESKNENDEISFIYSKAENETIQTPVTGRFSTPDRLESVLESLSNQQQSIYRFITQEASFEGFCRQDDRRETLDDWEGLKFASSGRYTLEQVVTRYRQVKEVWESRGSCHNPLALLHWTLTNDVDPRRGKTKASKAPASAKPANSLPPTRRPSYETPRARPQLSYQKRMFSPTELPSHTEAGEVLPVAESLKIFEPSRELKEPGVLWKVIYEDLTGRFQLSPANLALLQDATLRFREENPGQVEVVLRSIWEERQLDSSTRHLVKLALRQRLGPGLEVIFISK
jgi:hypothetical protein